MQRSTCHVCGTPCPVCYRPRLWEPFHISGWRLLDSNLREDRTNQLPWHDGEERERRPWPLGLRSFLGPRGYSASVCLLDALILFTGPVICRVLLSGHIAPVPNYSLLDDQGWNLGVTRLVAQRQKLLWHLDGPTSEVILSDFACNTVEQMLQRQRDEERKLECQPEGNDPVLPPLPPRTAAFWAAQKSAAYAAELARDPDAPWHDEKSYVTSARAWARTWDALNTDLVQRVHHAHRQLVKNA